MTVEQLEQLRAQLAPVSPEIRVVTPFQSSVCQAGLVAFRPQRQRRDENWITHQDTEVISYVLEGHGWLRLKEKQTPLSPGSICHIPAKTPHDFVAQGDQELLMFYVNVVL